MSWSGGRGGKMSRRGQSGDSSPSPSPWQQGDLTQSLAPCTFLLAVSPEPRARLVRPLPGLGRFQTGSHLSAWLGAGPGPNVLRKSGCEVTASLREGQASMSAPGSPGHFLQAGVAQREGSPRSGSGGRGLGLSASAEHRALRGLHPARAVGSFCLQIQPCSVTALQAVGIFGPCYYASGLLF